MCASGCTYSSVQAAINDITDSGPDNVYTILLDAGVLESDTSITFNPSGSSPKSYINFVGRGIGASVLRASTTWFQTTATGDFFDLSGSTNITIRGVTIDARTEDPGGLTPMFNTVRLDNADRILIDSARIEGVTYPVWESTNSSGHLIQIINSQIRGVSFGMNIRNGTWHIFSSDVRAVNDGGQSAVFSAHGIAIDQAPNVTIWGSHVHGETAWAGQTFAVSALRAGFSGGSVSNVAVIGSTLHVKVGTTDIGSATRPMYALYLVPLSGASPRKVDVVGTDILYESPAGMSQGRLAGLGYLSGIGTEISLVGASFIDRAGSGGTRGDILDGRAAAQATIPTIRSAGSRITTFTNAGGFSVAGSNIAAWFGTLNNRKGSVTFPGSSGAVSVTLSPAMPDDSYSVAVSPNTSESIYVTDKTTTGFTIRSPNSSSTASVDWIVIR